MLSGRDRDERPGRVGGPCGVVTNLERTADHDSLIPARALEGSYQAPPATVPLRFEPSSVNVGQLVYDRVQSRVSPSADVKEAAHAWPYW